MEVNEQLIQAITKAVVEQLQKKMHSPRPHRMPEAVHRQALPVLPEERECVRSVPTQEPQKPQK